MVILDVQLCELGTQRLHQGLSETILVNTLTDIREFKKKLPCSMEFETILLHLFYTICYVGCLMIANTGICIFLYIRNTAILLFYTICYVGCLMIANTGTCIFLYIRNTAILENNKSVCIFHINVWTPVTFTFTPRKLSKLTNRRHLYWVCANIFFKKSIKFPMPFKKKSSFVHLFWLRIARFPVGNGDIICPSKGADR